MTDTVLIVRNASVADTPAVMDLLSRIWQDDYVPHTWPEWLESADDITLVAELDGKVAGLCHVGRAGADECWFNAMRVDPQYHRRGIGTSLTKAAIDAARARGYRRALLGIDADNTASLAMTARTGFVRIADYAKLIADPRRIADSPRLRKAELADVPRLLAIAEESVRRDGVPAASYAGWEWASLTEEGLRRMVAAGEGYVIDGHTVDAYLPASFGDSDVDAFNPYGTVEAVVELVRGMLALAGEQNLPLCMFLPVNSPYSQPLVRLGMRDMTGDGYTIWQMDLQA